MHPIMNRVEHLSQDILPVTTYLSLSRRQLLRLAKSDPNILQSNSYLSTLSRIDLLNLLNGV